MTEETKNAAKSGPRGIILTIVVSFVVGWAYLLALTFSIQVGRAGFGLGEQCAGAITPWFLDGLGAQLKKLTWWWGTNERAADRGAGAEIRQGIAAPAGCCVAHFFSLHHPILEGAPLPS